MANGGQNIVENISKLVERILGAGLALNGQISLNGVTVTSVDKAKELGFLPQPSQQQEGSQGSGQEGKEQSSGQQGEQKNQSQGGQVSREELNSMMDEIRYLRKLMESSQDGQGQKGKTGQTK